MLKRIEIVCSEESVEKSLIDSNVECNEESVEKSVNDSNNESYEDLEKKMTAEMMAREGMEENFELREMFKNSYFFPICYDDAIIGVNPMTESVIYDYWSIAFYRLLFVEWIYPDYGDTIYGGARMIEWIENLTEETTQGKVKPTLCLLEMDKKKWEDVKMLDWGSPVERVRRISAA